MCKSKCCALDLAVSVSVEWENVQYHTQEYVMVNVMNE